MRYTTIIDIRDWPQIYANVNIRLLWLELSLGANYQTEKRDIYTGSLRSIAARTGITLSATRHALSVLEKNGLIKKTASGLAIKKWLPAEKPAPRKAPSATTAPSILEKSAAVLSVEKQKAAFLEEQKKNEAAHTTTFINRYERQYQQAMSGDAASLAFCRNKEYRQKYIKDCESTGHQKVSI